MDLLRMPKFAHACLAFGVVAGMTISLDPTLARAQQVSGDDPYLWLEDVAGDRALGWVREQNAKAESELASSADFKQLKADILAILDSDEKIPAVEKIGEYYYNFWKDKNHQRGLWRRTTLDEYRKDQPAWETLIDLDALNKAEGENWVWHGVECLKPKSPSDAYRRCLVALSRGGADADVTREFDLSTKRWVKDGFFREEAKGGLSWIDENTVFVATDFGSGSLTTSGYPRIAKRWKRGTPMSAAEEVYAGQAGDMAVDARRDDTPGFERDFVSRSLAFYNDELYLLGPDGKLNKVDAPNSANKWVHREWLTLELREPWAVGGKTYRAGTLLAARFDQFMQGQREFEVLFEPTDNSALSGFTWTRSHLVLNVLKDVKNELTVLTPEPNSAVAPNDDTAAKIPPGRWARAAFAGAPDIGSVAVSAVDADESDAIWLTATDFLTPTTLALVELGDGSGNRAPEKLKSNPVFFDASKHVVEQQFASSKDGTRVPYFLVRPKDLKRDGNAPTLLYGYGGFEVPLTPNYSGSVGKGWLEKGGVYALANIRGGGEYGPRWHQAALKRNRNKAYEDFAAVADDLVARKITRPERLGTQGASNGGLLMGNMLTQYPDKFGAIVVQVPLLDMQRYNQLLAGASWMAEYGDPDKPEEWKFIQTFSPYHLFDQKKNYPPVLFTTSTRDDRVHPGHARKMMAKMLAANKDVRYYENIEGGHGGAADNQQAAHMQTLAYTFLWQQLAD